MPQQITLPNDVNMERARANGIPGVCALARKLGISHPFLSQIRHGHRPMPAKRNIIFKRITGYDWVDGTVVTSMRMKA